MGHGCRPVGCIGGKPITALELFTHPFSSCCMKVLIALWSDDIDFTYRILDEDHPEIWWPQTALAVRSVPVADRRWRDSGRVFRHHRNLTTRNFGTTPWIPDGAAGQRARFLDRVFESYVMNTMTVPVFDAMQPRNKRHSSGVAEARATLKTAYDWLDRQVGDQWAVGDQFTLACAAGPSSTPTRRSAPRVRASWHIELDCWHIRQSYVQSRKHDPTGPIFHSAHPIGTRRCKPARWHPATVPACREA